MQNRRWKNYLYWIILCEAVGIIAALLTRSGMELFNRTASKPFLMPPPVLFPIVWGILYALMGIGAARINTLEDSKEKYKALNLFVIQLVFNFFWSLIFFNLQRYLFAFLWILILWLLILLMIRAFRNLDQLTANLQIPYLLWVTFAAYLNFEVWRLNR